MSLAHTRGTRGAVGAARVRTLAPVSLRRCPLSLNRLRLGAAGDTASATTETVITINDREHFEATLKECSESNKILVIDYYTTWCGPCKLIAPDVEKMAAEYGSKGVTIGKVTCDASNENKKWALAIAIKALPTFRVYRDGKEEHVGEMVGTKVDKLRTMLDEILTA